MGKSKLNPPLERDGFPELNSSLARSLEADRRFTEMVGARNARTIADEALAAVMGGKGRRQSTADKLMAELTGQAGRHRSAFEEAVSGFPIGASVRRGRLGKQVDDVFHLADLQKEANKMLMGGAGRGCDLSDFPPLPRNPIHETNDRLAKLEDKFEALIAVQVDGSAMQTRWNRAALITGALGIVVAVVAIVL